MDELFLLGQTKLSLIEVIAQLEKNNRFLKSELSKVNAENERLVIENKQLKALVKEMNDSAKGYTERLAEMGLSAL